MLCVYIYIFHPPNICLNFSIFLAQFCIYSCCDHPCLAQVLGSHPNSSSLSGCGWVEYLNDFWPGNKFLEGSLRIFKILKPNQPCLEQFGFVLKITNVSDDNNAGALINVNVTEKGAAIHRQLLYLL